jgi:hypothetical protein
MALLFCDSFDHYTTLTQKWDAVSANVAISSASARFGTAGGFRNNDQSIRVIRKSFGTNATTLIAGAAFQPGSLSAGNQSGILAFADGGTAQVTVLCDSTGQLTMNRGTNTATLGSSGLRLLTFGRWYYIELKAVIDPSAGSFEVRVDGVTWISGTGLNTRATANSQANGLLLSNGVGGGASLASWDDVYCCDTTGTANNDFLGDVGVRAVFPTGAGSSAQASRGGTDSGANWSQTDEATPNDDTDYVLDSTVGHKDLYAMGDLAATVSSVKAVQLLYRSRKDDAGTRTLKGKVKHSTTEGNGADQPQSASYAYFRDVFETNPSTGAAWTPSEVNAVEAGFEVVA